MGGLNFKKFEQINLALLTKLAWQLQVDKDRLWVQLFRTKYLQNTDLLTTTFFKNGTWAWKDIVESVPLLKKAACFFVRDGHISAIDCPWLPTNQSFKPTLLQSRSINIILKDLWTPGTKEWNIGMVRSLFIKEDAN